MSGDFLPIFIALLLVLFLIGVGIVVGAHLNANRKGRSVGCRRCGTTDKERALGLLVPYAWHSWQLLGEDVLLCSKCDHDLRTLVLAELRALEKVP